MSSVEINQAAINPATGNPFKVAEDPARPGNFSKARELLGELTELDVTFAQDMRDRWNLAREEGQYSKEYAVEQNGAIIDLLRELRRAARSGKQETHTVPTGRYAVDNNEGHTAFYRVVVGENGHTKVQVYSSDKLIDLKWNIGLAVIRKIEAQGIHESELRFGREGKRCYKCNRRLTDEVSLARGTGDDCASKG